MLVCVTAKLFSLRRSDGPPSTQFASTIMAMPEPDAMAPEGGAPEPQPQPQQGLPVDLPNSGGLPADRLLAEGLATDHPGSDTLAPDTLSTEGSGAHGIAPDIVTDLGGLPAEAPDPADAPTLSHIGRYALKRQLGAGGLGSVFEAWDPLLSRAVAVKTLQFDADPEARSSLDGLFLNEARAAAGLNHRYIVTVHDAGLSPHGVYIAMERLYGRDLQRALADGWRPGVEQAVQLVRRVNEALAYAHARGVVHCDIKPANIFLQRRDRPKVLDFGIARILHGGKLQALEGALVGSPRYRAPEQLTGGAIDARTDLFSLGVVMYELLTGRRAFPGETLAEINHAVLETDPAPAHQVERSVPLELSAIVSRLMARRPADRYTCASELNADLRRWLVENSPAQDLTLPAGKALVSPRPVTAPAASASSHRGLIMAAVALGVTAMASAAWLVLAPTTRSARPAATEALGPAATVPAVVAPAAAASGASLAAPAAAEALAPAPAEPQPTAPATTATTAPVPTPAPAPAPPAAAPARPAPEPAARARVAATELATRDQRRAEDNRAAAPAPAAAAAPAAPVMGLVNIAVSPWAEVEVNGQPQGTAPPLTRLTLPEGSHQITLRNADFAPHTVQVQVSGERPVTLRHRFGS